MTHYAKILATGSYLPKNILTNDELSERVDTSHDWIVERTGIESRHIAIESETTVSMGVEAARRAFEAGQLTPEDIGMVIVATCTPDKSFPSTACLIQSELGIPTCPAFDVHAVCSGFVYALSVADQFIRNNMVKRVLLIGSEVMSRVVDWRDRRTCILFGDGAGAVILEQSDKPGILATRLGADGRQKDILYLENRPDAYIQMQGNSLFKLAVQILESAAMEILNENKMTIDHIDWLVPHQANIRIIQATANKLGLSMDKVIITLKNQGNTSAASIPLALDYAIRHGSIKRGQNLLLEAIGGGLTWGTALVQY